MEREFKRADMLASKMVNASAAVESGEQKQASLQLRSAAHDAVRLADQLMSMAIVIEQG